MATTIAELSVQLNLELNRLDAQIKTANRRVADMGRRMNSDVQKAARAVNTALSSLGVGVGVGALVRFGKQILDLGGKINDLSQQAGISTDAFQTLAAVGKESGVTGEQIASAFGKMGQTIQDAAEGSKTAVDSLAKLNLTAAGLKALRPEQQFQLIAAQIVNATDKEKAFNAALDVLGSKSAPKLREVLQRLGTEGFQALSDQTAKVRFTDEQIKTLDDFGDSLGRIADALKVIGASKGLDVLNAATAGGSVLEKDPVEAARKLYDYNKGRYGDAHPITQRNLQELNSLTAQRSASMGSRSITPDMVSGLNERAALLEKAKKAEDELAQAAERRAEFDRQDQMQEVVSEAYFQEMTRLIEGERKLEEKRKDAKKALDEYAESVKDVLEPTREFAREEAKLLALVERGTITMDQAGRYLSQISDPDAGNPSGVSFDKVKRDAEYFRNAMFQIFDSVGDRAASTFADMVLTGENAFKSLATVAAKAMLEMAARLAVINPLLNMAFGLTGTNALPTIVSAFGGGKANGGPVSAGMLYQVNENGPEFFQPKQDGTIIPTNRLAMAGGRGGDTYYIDATGADRGAIARLEASIFAINGSIERRAVGAVREAERRRK